MKAILLLFTVLICASCLASSVPMAQGLYLRVVEIRMDPFDGVEALDSWIPVSDRAEAEVKLPAVLSEHFAGKQYEAYFHRHYLDRPCVWELLATGTYNP